VFAGPPGSELEVTRRYAQFASLLAPLGSSPERVLLGDRLAWQVRMTDGLVLELGRDAASDPVTHRLERFVEAYPRALGNAGQRFPHAQMRVDLRYPNGFALRVPGMERIDQDKAAKTRAARL
jgi:cell division protein FtsQ